MVWLDDVAHFSVTELLGELSSEQKRTRALVRMQARPLQNWAFGGDVISIAAPLVRMQPTAFCCLGIARRRRRRRRDALIQCLCSDFISFCARCFCTCIASEGNAV